MSFTILMPSAVPLTTRQQRENEKSPIPAPLHRRSLIKPSEALSTHPNPSKQPLSDLPGQHLQSSPYPELEHLLDLNTLDVSGRLMALALTTMRPVTPAYATSPYSETFDWSEVFTRLRDLAEAENFHFPRTEFYVVEFRSKLKENLDHDLLFSLDKYSHQEATASGGLLKYWFGSPDAERRNLATCLWRSKEDAIAGGKGPWHRKAREIVSQTYESIHISGLRLVIEDGVEGWKFEPFSFDQRR